MLAFTRKYLRTYYDAAYISIIVSIGYIGCYNLQHDTDTLIHQCMNLKGILF